MISDLPRAKVMLGDRGYDARLVQGRSLPSRHLALHSLQIQPPHPQSPTTRPSTASDNRIENMFGRLKDWRRVHTRYDRCAHTFMAAIVLAATVIFWL